MSPLGVIRNNLTTPPVAEKLMTVDSEDEPARKSHFRGFECHPGQ